MRYLSEISLLKTTMSVTKVRIAELLSVKIIQADPAYVSFALSAGHFVTSCYFFNWCFTTWIGASLSSSWILPQPFFEFLLSVFTNIVHFTAKSIVVLFMTFRAGLHSARTADESLSIFSYGINHLTIGVGQLHTLSLFACKYAFRDSDFNSRNLNFVLFKRFKKSCQIKG